MSFFDASLLNFLAALLSTALLVFVAVRAASVVREVRVANVVRALSVVRVVRPAPSRARRR